MHKNKFHQHKNFGKPRKIQSVSQRELREKIASVEVIKKGKAAYQEELPPVPATSFVDFHLSPKLLDNILSKGYTNPTPIQLQTVPSILLGRDVIGIANTGTGKTAAFLIPLVNKVYNDKGERVLIIAPTRELAVQIHEELKSFTKGLGVFSTLLIGGMSMKRQMGDLRQSPHFVIGTPGRIRDIIKERGISMGMFNNVVLDEADRMVDIGFIRDIQYFISLLPIDRQSLFFSATIDGKVQEILQSFVVNPVTASVKQQDTAENVQQEIIEIEPGYKKIDKLHDLLAQEEFKKVLLFGRTKWGIQKLTAELMRRGFRVAAIHGNKNQNQRQRALKQFKNGEIQVLLATDVASRGLDIPNVTHVINYDMPATIEDYIHRIGRTGRADKKGIAITFVEKNT
ncbi:MAG TPA: DEAD/DEAH box helicase [Patescibacteria group bacterium]|nr:DEAD/DEAH box helicase [Patescibacteria group bacterium]